MSFIYLNQDHISLELQQERNKKKEENDKNVNDQICHSQCFHINHRGRMLESQVDTCRWEFVCFVVMVTVETRLKASSLLSWQNAISFKYLNFNIRPSIKLFPLVSPKAPIRSKLEMISVFSHPAHPSA